MVTVEDQWKEEECAHPDCDGWIHHSRTTIRTEHGGYKPACTVCGELEMIGSFGSESAALGFAAAHESFQRCDGRCSSWA
jgi:hypothetical protein